MSVRGWGGRCSRSSTAVIWRIGGNAYSDQDDRTTLKREEGVSAQYKSALIRGVILGLFTGVSTGLSTWATTGDLKTILVAGGTAFLAPLIVRAAGEGSFDTNRASKGEVRSGDVQPLPAAPLSVPAGVPTH